MSMFEHCIHNDKEKTLNHIRIKIGMFTRVCSHLACTVDRVDKTCSIELNWKIQIIDSFLQVISGLRLATLHCLHTSHRILSAEGEFGVFFFITHVILTAHRSKLINILIVFVREQMVCITLCSNLTKQLIILIALFVVKIKKSVHMGWFSVYSIMWAFCSSFRMTERLSADHLIAPSIYKLVPHIYRWFSALKLSVSR